MNILETIVKRKNEEIEIRKKAISENDLSASLFFDKKAFSLSASILNRHNHGIIAEFKRKSPSKSNIHLDADVIKVTSGYSESGASGLSVLTDIDFFGGSDDDLKTARAANQIPILRKDFTVDPYQIIEAKSLGADAILLIAEILTKEEIKSFSNLAISIGLEILLEIHTADQIKKYHENIRIVGVNNRNLKTFTTDIQYSKDLYSKLPMDTVKISESGINDPKFVVELIQTGYQGFLIGENFMKTNDPGKSCSDFIKAINTML